MKRLIVAIVTVMTMLWTAAALADGAPTVPPDVRGQSAQTVSTEADATPTPEVEVIDFITYPQETPAPTQRTGRLSGMLIGLDPGHQAHAHRDKEPLSPGSKELKNKVSSGTQGVKTRINEYETNLTIALKLRDRLEAEGARVVMTRTTHDVNISNVERAQMMNAAGVDIWLRIHCNGSDNHDVHGMSMYVRDSGPCADESYAAGEMLLEEMTATTGAQNRGVHKSDSYTGNNWSEVPCVLVEMGYESNPDEDVKLNDGAYQDKLIEGYVNALERWNNKYNRPKVSQPENNGVM